MIESPPAQRTTMLDLAVFLAELALLAVLAVAGARLGGPLAVRIVLAIALPVVIATVWGRWLAPRAGHRLSWAPGFALKLVLFTGAAVLLAASGAPVWAVVFWVPCALVVTAAEIGRGRRGGVAGQDAPGSGAPRSTARPET